MNLPIEEWLNLRTDEKHTYHEEIKSLFLSLEDELRKKDLLTSSFLAYRTFHFTQLCRTLYRASSNGQDYR